MEHHEGEVDVLFSQPLEDHVVTPDGVDEGTISQAIMIVRVAWNILPLLAVAVVSKKTVTRECTSDSYS